jgi:hypothetical protein
VAPPASFRLVPRPTLSSVSPSVGPAAGGTTIVVQGTNFIEPVDSPFFSRGSELLLDGHAIPSIWTSPAEIHATLPSHDPGAGVLTVANGAAETGERIYFAFIAAPILKLVAPLVGPVAGGTRIVIGGSHFRAGDTKITIGGADLGSPVYVSDKRIEGIVPPASAPGPAPIVATDGIGQSSTLLEMFVYEPGQTDAPDGGPDPVSSEGAP